MEDEWMSIGVICATDRDERALKKFPTFPEETLPRTH